MTYWKKNLLRPVRIAGRVATTLEDAARHLRRLLRNEKQEAVAAPAMHLLNQAAETGAHADIATVTEHLEDMAESTWDLPLADICELPGQAGPLRTLDQAIGFLMDLASRDNRPDLNDAIDALIYAGSTGKRHDIEEATHRFEDALRRRNLLKPR